MNVKKKPSYLTTQNFPAGGWMGVSGRHFIGLLSGGFLVIIATKGSSKVPQGPSPPLLLTVVVDFVTLLTCCNKSFFVILIHCVTVATVTTPTKTKRKRRRTNKNCFLEFQRLTNGTNPWEKIKTKRNEMKQNLTPNQLNYENKMEMKPLSLGL